MLVPLKELSALALEEMQLPMNLNLNQHPVSSSSYFFFLSFDSFDFPPCPSHDCTLTGSGPAPIFTQTPLNLLLNQNPYHQKPPNYQQHPNLLKHQNLSKPVNSPRKPNPPQMHKHAQKPKSVQKHANQIAPKAETMHQKLTFETSIRILKSDEAEAEAHQSSPAARDKERAAARAGRGFGHGQAEGEVKQVGIQRHEGVKRGRKRGIGRRWNGRTGRSGRRRVGASDDTDRHVPNISLLFPKISFFILFSWWRGPRLLWPSKQEVLLGLRGYE